MGLGATHRGQACRRDEMTNISRPVAAEQARQPDNPPDNDAARLRTEPDVWEETLSDQLSDYKVEDG
jgi:hypothetical protein